MVHTCKYVHDIVRRFQVPGGGGSLLGAGRAGVPRGTIARCRGPVPRLTQPPTVPTATLESRTRASTAAGDPPSRRRAHRTQAPGGAPAGISCLEQCQWQLLVAAFTSTTISRRPARSHTTGLYRQLAASMFEEYAMRCRIIRAHYTTRSPRDQAMASTMRASWCILGHPFRIPPCPS